MKVWNTVKLGLTLTAYAAAVCVGLAFVYGATKAVIDQRETASLETAIKELFPDADSFNEITEITSPDSAVTFGSQYSITRDGKLIGVALEASTGSYSGPINVLVGVGSEKITRIKILSHTDTPGLGANAAKANYFVDRNRRITFYDQFAGKAVTDSFEPKNDVIAITAATITSRAVSLAVRTAGRAAVDWLAAEGAAP
jgi:electron transport complex protein RnfG